MIKGLMLDLDISVIYIIVIIGILLWVLNKIFYKPVGEIINSREEKISKESDEIEKLTKELEIRSEEIEKTLKLAKRDSAKLKDEIIKEGEMIRSEMLAKTREEAEKLFTEKMKKLDTDIIEAERKLKSEIGTFTEKIERIFV